MTNGQSVACIGSVYLETNYLGTETAGSEALISGKEYRSLSYTTGLGGSAVNVAVQLSALNVPSVLIGKVGDDDKGRQLRALVNTFGVGSTLLIVSSSVQTSVDTGVVLAHSGQNIQLVSGNANQTLSFGELPLDHPSFSSVSAVYLGGYFKQEMLYKDYPALVATLKKMKKRIFLDHGRVPVDVHKEKIEILRLVLPEVDCYFPNESELLAITETKTTDDAIRVVQTYGARLVVIKQGARGCTVLERGQIQSFSTRDVRVKTTVGAGDAFNVGFIFQYLAGADVYKSAVYANKVATYKVQHNLVVTNDMLDN